MHRSNLRLVMTLLVRDEADIVRDNLAYLQSLQDGQHRARHRPARD